MQTAQTWKRFLSGPLKRGEINITEAAWIAGVSRQSVLRWCTAMGIRVADERHKYLLDIKKRGERWMMKQGMIDRPQGPYRSKSRLRRDGEQAMRDWDGRRDGAD